MRERLDVSLVRRGLVASRSVAQRLIADGAVRVSGQVVERSSAKVDTETRLDVDSERLRFVGRGGEKLDHALKVFGVDVREAEAIDCGSSTGGFTDCLLQHGAARVLAVDVGTDQLVAPLRRNARVTVMEQTDIRSLDPAAVGAPFDVVVADLSFISLRTVLPVLAGLGGRDTSFLLLVKPQFEVGRSHLGHSGVVRDAAVRHEAVRGVVVAAAECGLTLGGVTPSGLPGSSGNIEYMVLLCRGEPTASLWPDMRNAP